MAVLSNNDVTLLELAKRLDPDGSIAMIVEMLQQDNEILNDMVWKEGNLVTGNRTTVRTGLPEPTWRKMYQGVQPTKSTTAQITDNTGMLEAYAEVDKALADLNGNTASFRLSEDRPHIEGISQTIAETIFYGNEGTNPAAFTGFSPRFNDPTADNGVNIINAGGTGTDNQSIWLIVWGDNAVHGIVPKGSQAGIQMHDKGQVTIENVDGAGGRMEAYRSHYRMDAGLTVRDWRQVVRICNISKSALKADGSSGPNLPELMFEATERVHRLTGGTPVFYMSRGVRTVLRQQAALLTKGSTLEYQNTGGIRLMSFAEVPVRRVDALAADEALVTGF